MPDLKFKKSKFYFSLLSDSGGFHPLLIPRINNPDFFDADKLRFKSPPGIIQILSGDVGIGEMIMTPILSPVLLALDLNPLLAESIANANSPYLDNINSGDVNKLTGQEAISKAKSNMVKNLIPKDNGVKALEKTVITSMMESHKPIIEFLKIFIEMLAIAEDVVCMFLGTSIKIFGKQIGFPSRNPKYWSEELGYAQTLNYALDEFRNTIGQAIEEFDKQMPDENPLKNNISGDFRNTEYESPKPESIYVGFYNDKGDDVTPPSWVKNSGKWLEFDVQNRAGRTTTIGSPFKRLSSDYETGIRQLRDNHFKSISKLDKEKEIMLNEIDKRGEQIKTMGLSGSRLKTELDSIDSEKKQAGELFDGLNQAIIDVLDGTNVAGANYKDDEDRSQGINPPAIISEWSSKVRSAQLRQKYFPEQVSTTQSLVDFRNKPKEPYVFVPKVEVNYFGRDVEMEVPLAFSNQIKQKKVKVEDGRFFDKRIGVNKAKRTIVDSFDLYYGTDGSKPFKDEEITHFNHDIKNEYVPDKIKNYYMPLEWEEVLEYEIRNTTTGKVLRTETEIIPQSIDIENDYEIRLIKVVNVPLSGSNKRFNHKTKDFVKEVNGIKYYYSDEDLDKNVKKKSFLEKYKALKKKTNKPSSLGVIMSKGNNIPRKNTSTLDIDEENLLKEGLIYQGLDPRYIHPNKFKVFWLVEAIKKDKRGIAAINGKFNPKDVAEAENNTDTTNENLSEEKGKEWYGLLDKFRAIPEIIIRLVPLIATKLIPLIVKIIQLVSNPTKIKDLLLEMGITDESISKFPQSFPDYSKEKGLKDIDDVIGVDIPTTIEEDEVSTTPKKRNYYTGLQTGVVNPSVVTMIDGQAIVDFGLGAFKKPIITFGLDLKAASSEEKFKIITKKTPQSDFTKPAPVKEQPIFSFILNTIKLPFEVIFKMFMWIIDWVKKLLNPLKIPAAIIEFLSFSWFKDIIGKDSLFEMLGMNDPMDNAKLQDFINNPNLNQEDLVNNLLSILSGKDAEKYVEVLVYNILKNGDFLRSETVERPYDGNVPNQGGGGNNNGNGNNTVSGNGVNNNNGKSNINNGNKNPTPENPKYGNNAFDFICGDRDFSINDLFPIPFLPKMPNFNLCELPLIFLKPLELILGILKMIQETLNGLLAMPIAIFGLEPTISIPKFGQEIPFADVFERVIDRLKDELTPTFPQPNK